jgi:predicted transposase YdaD
MKYDITAKAIIDIAKEDILERFLGIKSESIELLEELPEETTSIRRSDFPLLVTLKDKSAMVVILEIQTHFDNDFVLRLVDYTVRFKLKYHLKVEPWVLLLTPSSIANGFYEDDVLIFKYNVISLWKQNAEDFMDKLYLYPFLPLMNGGEKLLEQAETNIYKNSEISRDRKSDLLSAMAIFAGLKDKNLGSWLVERRRDIMIESPIYDLIKEEGIREGIKRGIEQGIEQGIKQGRKQAIYDALALALEIKFGIDGIVLMEKVRKVESIERLETIKEAIKISKDIKEIENLV